MPEAQIPQPTLTASQRQRVGWVEQSDTRHLIGNNQNQ